MAMGDTMIPSYGYHNEFTDEVPMEQRHLHDGAEQCVPCARAGYDKGVCIGAILEAVLIMGGMVLYQMLKG